MGGLTARLTVNLVGGNVDKPSASQLTEDLQQYVSPEDIGADEARRIANGPVYVGLGGEVDHVVDPIEHRAHCGLISHIGLHEAVPWIVGHFLQVIQVACIRKLVKVDYVVVGMMGQQVLDEVAADEPGPPGDKAGDHVASSAVASAPVKGDGFVVRVEAMFVRVIVVVRLRRAVDDDGLSIAHTLKAVSHLGGNGNHERGVVTKVILLNLPPSG